MTKHDELANEIRDAVFQALGKAAFAYRPESIWAADPIDMVRAAIMGIIERYDFEKWEL
jgi:hypothetical protein